MRWIVSEYLMEFVRSTVRLGCFEGKNSQEKPNENNIEQMTDCGHVFTRCELVVRMVTARTSERRTQLTSEESDDRNWYTEIAPKLAGQKKPFGKVVMWFITWISLAFSASSTSVFFHALAALCGALDHFSIAHEKVWRIGKIHFSFIIRLLIARLERFRNETFRLIAPPKSFECNDFMDDNGLCPNWWHPSSVGADRSLKPFQRNYSIN